MKKKLAIMFACCTVLSLTIGCNTFAAEAVDGNDIKIESHGRHPRGVAAKVVSVNENTITVNLEERPEMPEGEDGERPERPERPEGEDGERPERPKRPEGEDGERPERPEMLEGEMPPEMPDGEKPEMLEGEMPPEKPEGERHFMLRDDMTFSEEETEVEYTQDVVIAFGEGQTGSIQDIEPGDIIMIDYQEGDTAISRIFVNQNESE